MRALIATLLLGLTIPAYAHGPADWINKGNYRNAVGELCCGEQDCRVTTAQTVTLPIIGYRLPSGETIPQDMAQPSPDGQFWVCAWGGKIKCFFSPIPTM